MQMEFKEILNQITWHNFKTLIKALKNEPIGLIILNLKNNFLNKKNRLFSPTIKGDLNVSFETVFDHSNYKQYYFKPKSNSPLWEHFIDDITKDIKKKGHYFGKSIFSEISNSTKYHIVNGKFKEINFRENLICSQSRTNSRQRAVSLVINQLIEKKGNLDSVYFTEMKTPFFELYKEYFPNVIGSEFLGNCIPLGTTDKQGIRNEDLTNLTFTDNKFDLIVCLEVLEHIPEYKKALYELFRVMKPEGHLIFTVPFKLGNPKTEIRAELDSSGKIIHHMEPEYHGDPVGSKDKGVLCYYNYGWDLINDTMKSIGFHTNVHLIRSKENVIWGKRGS